MKPSKRIYEMLNERQEVNKDDAIIAYLDEMYIKIEELQRYKFDINERGKYIKRSEVLKIIKKFTL